MVSFYYSIPFACGMFSSEKIDTYPVVRNLTKFCISSMSLWRGELCEITWIFFCIHKLSLEIWKTTYMLSNSRKLKCSLYMLCLLNSIVISINQSDWKYKYSTLFKAKICAFSVSFDCFLLLLFELHGRCFFMPMMELPLINQHFGRWVIFLDGENVRKKNLLMG